MHELMRGYRDNGNQGAVWVYEKKPGETKYTALANQLRGTDSVGTPYQGWSLSMCANGSVLAFGGYGKYMLL